MPAPSPESPRRLPGGLGHCGPIRVAVLLAGADAHPVERKAETAAIALREAGKLLGAPAPAAVRVAVFSKGAMMRFPVVSLLLVLLGGTVVVVLAGSAPEAAKSDPARVEAPGLHNVFRITDRLYSGSSPDGDEGFRSLKRLGVKTIISVDGLRPDVARAHKYGMRYVHLPFGYDGVPREQALRIARAVRDLPGPVYIHCHHGQHRGPAAAAVAHLCLDRSCTVEMALAEMRRAGTDPHYKGLYAAPRELRRPTKEELDRVSADFPEVAPVAALAEVMVGVDKRWDRLKQIKAAGWRVPRNHPDLDPPHEALQLVEQYREAARLPSVRRRPEEFRRWLADAEAAARNLERALRGDNDRGPVDAPAAAEAFRRLDGACVRCHGKYRDVKPNRTWGDRPGGAEGETKKPR
jgi:protein tyrosine phosphatase (PTP) superfamily phosphohydrolase (DUF442 family)